MINLNEKCWICGSNALTGEHKTKNSDLKLVFGSFSQSNPIYYHDARGVNQIARGPRSSILKFSYPICEHCNNERTQPHDRAWEDLSSWFRKHISAIKPGGTVSANSFFPHDTEPQMLNVHLYFVKLFGCSLKEADGKIPIPLGPLADAIKENQAHPNIYLRFAHGPAAVGASDIHFEQVQGGMAQIAGWSYVIDGVQVKVFFAKSIASVSEWVKVSQVWHPKLGTNMLSIADFRRETEAMSPGE